MKKALTHITVLSVLLLVSAGSAFANQPVNPGGNGTINIIPTAIGPVATDANGLVRFIINAMIVIGVIASLIFLLWGGLRWILSGGDKGKVDAARSTIVAAIVGLVIVILAYVIVNTVLTIVTGSGLSGFTLPTLSNPNATKF